MNPEQLCKSGTEHAEQMALMCWANMAARLGFEFANDMRTYGSPIASAQHVMNGKQSVYDRGVYPVPALKWLHAIPNAGARGNKVAAAQLKAEGVKAGVADICLPVSRFAGPVLLACGLYIELKRANGRPSDVTKEQDEFGQFVSQQGYMWRLCFGWRHAANVIEAYLKNVTPNT